MATIDIVPFILSLSDSSSYIVTFTPFLDFSITPTQVTH